MKSIKIVLPIIIIFISFYSQAQSSVTVIRQLPRESKIVVHSGVHYRYHGVYYYKPYGRYYVVVRPPVGLRLTILPTGYTRVVLGNIAYFYAGGVYYIERATGNYEVIAPPKELVTNNNAF